MNIAKLYLGLGGRDFWHHRYPWPNSRTGDRGRSAVYGHCELVQVIDNPYQPPTYAAKLPGSKGGSMWLSIILGGHAAAVLASVYVVRSHTILSDRMLETAVALPLVSTIVLSPVAMVFVVIFKRKWTWSGMTAIVADVLLSWLQMLIWLPTVQ